MQLRARAAKGDKASLTVEIAIVLAKLAQWNSLDVGQASGRMTPPLWVDKRASRAEATLPPENGLLPSLEGARHGLLSPRPAS
jgi:hypothetical protein